MSVLRRSLIIMVVGAIATISLVAGGSGGADAKRGPAQLVWALNAGDTTWAVGKNGCRGPIRVQLQTDPAKRGHLYVTYRPGVFAGNDPAWRQNPELQRADHAQCELG